MADTPIQPALSPANTDRTAFNQALACCASAIDHRQALPTSAGILAEIAAGEAVQLAHEALARTTAPDHGAFATKLRLTLTNAGVPAGLLVDLSADVRHLARMVEGRA